ncbi:hypothetical protein [Nostoc sp.]
MFLAIFQKVKDFFIRIVKDETFHSQLLSKKVEELKKTVENGSMQIADLPYLQNVSKDELILGSRGVNVISGAFAFGSDSYPFASANSSSKAWSTDDYTSNGTGLAEAWGDNATANLATAGNGNIVIGNSKFKSYVNTASASGSVISIDSDSVLSISDLFESLF